MTQGSKRLIGAVRRAVPRPVVRFIYNVRRTFDRKVQTELRFLKASVCREKGDVQGASLLWQRATKYPGFRSRSADLAAVMQLVGTGISHATRQLEISQNLREILSRIPDSELSIDGWLTLRYGLTSQGFLVAGGIAREKAANQVLTRATNEPTNRNRLFGASVAFERADFEHSIALLGGANSWGDQQEPCWSLRALLDIVTGNKFRDLPISDLSVHGLDPLFSSLVKDKSVAIVGPASPVTEQGANIDSYDVVVRLKYFGRSSMPDQKFVGTRSDVSYYNGQLGALLKQSENNSSKQVFSFLDDLSFTVMKQFQHILEKQKSRVAFSPTVFQFSKADPYLLNIVLFDLLMYQPRVIKIFNSNLYHSKNTSFDDYFEQWHQSPKPKLTASAMLRNFAGVDICEQFQFEKSLVSAKIVDVDEELNNVLGKTLLEYLLSMENIYRASQDLIT